MLGSVYMYILYYPIIPVLDIYSTVMFTKCLSKCMHKMFIEVLFEIGKSWKQPKYLSVVTGINEL